MSKIEKAAARAMDHIQRTRTGAVNVMSETGRLAYADVPAGPKREALLTISNRAAATVESMNAAESELAAIVQAIRKEEAAKPAPQPDAPKPKA